MEQPVVSTFVPVSYFISPPVITTSVLYLISGVSAFCCVVFYSRQLYTHSCTSLCRDVRTGTATKSRPRCKAQFTTRCFQDPLAQLPWTCSYLGFQKSEIHHVFRQIRHESRLSFQGDMEGKVHVKISSVNRFMISLAMPRVSCFGLISSTTWKNSELLQWRCPKFLPSTRICLPRLRILSACVLVRRGGCGTQTWRASGARTRRRCTAGCCASPRSSTSPSRCPTPTSTSCPACCPRNSLR